MPQLNPNILKLAGVVFLFGLVLLALTYVGPLLFGVAMLGLVVYIAYQLLKDWNK